MLVSQLYARKICNYIKGKSQQNQPLEI